MGVMNTIKVGGGGGGEGGGTSLESSLWTDFSFNQRVATDVAANMNASFYQVTVPTGRNLLLHKMVYETDDQTYGRLSSVIIDGNIVTLNRVGNHEYEFVSEAGAPILVTGTIGGEFSTLSGAPAAVDHKIYFIGRLINE